MRTDLSLNRPGWIDRLGRIDYKKIILIALLARLIFASAYDIFVTMTGREVLLPDGVFYSMRGRYIQAIMNGYTNETVSLGMVPDTPQSRAIFTDIVYNTPVHFPGQFSETALHTYIIAALYFVFGYAPIVARVFNIALSICSVYFLFAIARTRFGKATANLFLLIALFLPSQVGYSITLSRDFVRMFVICLILWVIYD